MATSGSFTTYKGLMKDLPETASTGIQFLSVWMQTIDSLDQSKTTQKLPDLMAPTATFISNGGEPVPAAQIIQMFEHREKMLSVFTHKELPVSVFDLQHEPGRRTVICECTSQSVFKNDPEQEAAEVHELLIVELVGAASDKGHLGLWVVEAKTYMDPSPVMTKAKVVMAKPGA